MGRNSYCLQIATLHVVLKILKREKWVKYVSERTDDVTHSIQCYCLKVYIKTVENLTILTQID